MGFACGFLLFCLSYAKNIYPNFSILDYCPIFCESKNNNEEVSSLIEAKRAEVAPDKRVSLWDLTFENDSLKGETNQPEALEALIEELNAQQISFTDAVSILPEASLGEKPKHW